MLARYVKAPPRFGAGSGLPTNGSPEERDRIVTGQVAEHLGTH